jgi:hypothetical protein
MPIMPSGPPDSGRVVPAAQAVPVGFLGYKVASSKFESESMSSKESRLLVEHAVVNTGASEHALPPLKVVNEAGVEFTAEGSVSGRAAPLANKLPPGGTTKGVVTFKVPRSHSYKLKIQDGSPPETVLIELPLPKPTK